MADLNSTSDEVPIYTHRRELPVARMRRVVKPLKSADENYSLTVSDSQVNQDFSSQTDIEARIRLISTRFKSTIDELVGSLKLAPNWDGDEGFAPSERTVSQAALFLAKIHPFARPPKPYVVGDGEVGFVWSGPDYHVEIGFFPDDEVAILADSPYGVIKDVFTSRSLPMDQLREILRRL